MPDGLVCDDCEDDLKADTISYADPRRCQDCVENSESSEIRELIRYEDALGRKTRLAIDGDAWVRQEWRRGTWWTTERHPVNDLSIPLDRRAGTDQEATA